MLITKNLPIDSNKFAQQDQILTITGATWQDYQQFEAEEYPGYRVSYLNGEITIMSPGRNHEKIAEVISRLIIAYCEKFEIQDFPFRQTRLEVKDYAGKEPDVAYAFNTDKELPDLVVEVIFSSGNLDERPQRGCLGGHSLAQNTELGKPRTRSWASVFRRRGLPPLPRYDREGCRGSLGLPNRGVGNARV